MLARSSRSWTKYWMRSTRILDMIQEFQHASQSSSHVILTNAAFQTEDLDTYDSDCDDLSNAQVVILMPNIPTMIMNNKQLSDFNKKNDISSYSNIIHNHKDLQETQQATNQATNLQAQQETHNFISVIEQISEQMINHVNNWEKANKEQNNESITAELERYKEKVKTFEQRLNIDLSSREK
ncbi:hypothetical protein Tco_0682065 [Tanacetum coccineum]|uniref:Uncharacterized protein n=1 Tax=Tanacetum coccineum TaxID=301880 RepID=A0ABQ4XRN4_9ASTR